MHDDHALVVHDQTGGADDDLVLEVDLAAWRGVPAAGLWRVDVVDNATQDTGSLVRWDLEFELGLPTE